MKNEIVKLLEDRDFVQQLMTIEDVEDVKKLFKNKGVEVSDSDINELGEIMNEIVETLGKMSEEELRAICGGGPKQADGSIPREVAAKGRRPVCMANLLRKIVGYEATTAVEDPRYNEDEWLGVVNVGKSTGSAVKDFIGAYANEIAASTITLTAATAIVGGAYGIKKGIRWYRRNYSK